jgi:hypothetical protein
MVVSEKSIQHVSALERTAWASHWGDVATLQQPFLGLVSIFGPSTAWKLYFITSKADFHQGGGQDPGRGLPAGLVGVCSIDPVTSWETCSTFVSVVVFTRLSDAWGTHGNSQLVLFIVSWNAAGDACLSCRAWWYHDSRDAEWPRVTGSLHHRAPLTVFSVSRQGPLSWLILRFRAPCSGRAHELLRGRLPRVIGQSTYLYSITEYLEPLFVRSYPPMLVFKTSSRFAGFLLIFGIACFSIFLGP